ncbi:unnamed protein product [Ectocarpus sp. 12 AP-2014]
MGCTMHRAGRAGPDYACFIKMARKSTLHAISRWEQKNQHVQRTRFNVKAITPHSKPTHGEDAHTSNDQLYNNVHDRTNLTTRQNFPPHHARSHSRYCTHCTHNQQVTQKALRW